MDIIDKSIIGAGLIGVGYVLYKFSKPLGSVGDLTGNVADLANKGVTGVSNTLDFGIGALVDLTGGNSQNIIKTNIQETAKKSAVATTTFYDNVTNDFSINKQKLSNLFTGSNAQTNVTRYMMSKDNDRNIGVSEVANTFIVDNNENYLGAYSNVLKQSTILNKEEINKKMQTKSYNYLTTGVF